MTKLVERSDVMRVGTEEIGTQHKVLVEILDELRWVMIEHRGPDPEHR